MKIHRIVFLLGVFFLTLQVQACARTLRDAFREVSPAVVTIGTLEKEARLDSPRGMAAMRGLGSGVLISSDGEVMTAAHVVQTADRIDVKFPSGEVVRASVTASAPWADVSLLKLERVPEGASPVRLGDSDRMEVGHRVFVVGAPYGISHTLSPGYIAGRHKTEEVTGDMVEIELFQTDAAINTGNSGGPMFNMDGEVIGIVSHILTRSGGSEGLGFAVTSNVAERLLLSERSYWTGISGVLLKGPLARIFNVPQEAGFLVQRVAEGSPAERLGLKPGYARVEIRDHELLVGGDIILAIGDRPFTQRPACIADMQCLLDAYRPDDEVRVKILRGGEILELTGKY